MEQMDPQMQAAAGAVGLIVLAVYALIFILIIASWWAIFVKAGKPGWAAIIPIYNIVVLLEVVGRPIWWIILFLIPFVNFIMSIIVCNDLSKKFGRGIGTTIGLVLLPFIFYPILGFGGAKYSK